MTDHEVIKVLEKFKPADPGGWVKVYLEEVARAKDEEFWRLLKQARLLRTAYHGEDAAENVLEYLEAELSARREQ